MYQQIAKELQERGYEEKGLIGEGAFGKVYRVSKQGTKKIYACKIGMNAGKEHVHREAALLKKIKHPLFTNYVEYWEEQDYACLITEYVSGSNLEEFIKRRRKLSEVQTLEIAMELAEGLLFLHKESIIFRDITAQNIVIRQDGRVKLLDLGCACIRKENTGVKAGTPGYAPVEQLQQGKAEVCSDIYSLGKVMQYMISGINPCMTTRKQYEELWKKEKCRVKLKNIVNLCVKENPNERMPNMYILLRSLKCLSMRSRKSFSINFYLEKNIWESNYKI